jgi:hypothetical protein
VSSIPEVYQVSSPDQLRFGVAALTKRPGLTRLALCGPGLLALILWSLSLRHIDVENLGSYGLPPALPVTWYFALSLSVIGAVTAIVVPRSTGLLMFAYVIVIAIILYATVPAISAQPHYAWVYKHFGVVRYFEMHGKVNPNIDIYNRWPGFFAFGALFSTVAGRANPETYAAWAELFFLVFGVLLVIAAVRTVTRDMRIAAASGLLFLLTNWVGQSYYSPQAFTFPLGLALILILLRHLRVHPLRPPRRITRLLRRIVRVPQLSAQRDETAIWPRWAAITAVLALDGVTVASHQLTPYMLLGGVALLMIGGVIRPWWMFAGMALITFTYLGINFDYVQHNFGLFTSIDPFNNVQRVTGYSKFPQSGKAFNAHAGLALSVALWLGALIAALRLLKRELLERALPFVLLGLAPFAIILGQNYGGEAPLRIVLFSSPWCAALIAWAVATVTRRWARWLSLVVIAGIFTALFVPSFFGQEELNIIPAGEVRASGWFYDHARPGSVLVLSSPGFPLRYGATYFHFTGPEGDADPNLLSGNEFRGRQLGPNDVASVVSVIKQYSRTGYLVFSRTQTEFSQVFGLTPPGALERLQRAVAVSPEFRLWYGNADAQIYEYVGAART